MVSCGAFTPEILDPGAGRAAPPFCPQMPGIGGNWDRNALKRDENGLNRHRALALCLSMIFSENRFTLFRIMPQPAVPAVAAQKRPLLYGDMNFPFEALYNVR